MRTPQVAELLLPAQLGASDAADRLASSLPVVTQRAHTLDRTYWDTFDGRLHRAGLTLAAAAGRLVLAERGTQVERAAAALPRGARRLLLGDVPDGALRAALAPIVELRALCPIARVHSRRLPIDVLDDVGKVVVRLRAEEPSALPGGDARVALPPRLHVVGVRGYDDDFERVLALLTGELALRPATGDVLDDAVVAHAAGPVGGVSAKLRVALAPSQRADAAAVAIATQLLATIRANLPGALADVDSEFLHDLRVAVRRTRSLQRELSGVFEREALSTFRDGFRELQAVTGPTRDLDVQLLELDDLASGVSDGAADALGPLRELLEQRRASARQRMEAELRSARTRALLDGWAAYLGDLVEAPAQARPDAARPVAEVAAERIRRVHRRMVRMGRAIDDASPHEALHDLRKQGKELRYLLEFFADLFPSDVVKPLVAALKGLQDALGRFQDREVQAQTLRALGPEIAARDGGPAALMAMGVLAEHLVAEQHEARTRFAASFERFAAKPQRRLVDATFG